MLIQVLDNRYRNDILSANGQHKDYRRRMMSAVRLSALVERLTTTRLVYTMRLLIS